jgi:hypothetical protein
MINMEGMQTEEKTDAHVVERECRKKGKHSDISMA